MACCFVVALGSLDQIGQAAEAKLRHTLQCWPCASRAAFLCSEQSCRQMPPPSKSVAVLSAVPLNCRDNYDFVWTLKLNSVLPLLKISVRSRNSTTVHPWTCVVLICSPMYGIFMLLCRFLLNENRLSYHKAESNQEFKFDILFKKLYSCLQFGMKSRLRFKLVENWLRCL